MDGLVGDVSIIENSISHLAIQSHGGVLLKMFWPDVIKHKEVDRFFYIELIAINLKILR